MKVIVGLGNPGQTFRDTRHNVGFQVVQRLADRHGVSIGSRVVSPDGRPAGVYGDYETRRQQVRLLMPLTMMNESGEALRAIELAPQDLMIVCDDVNLPLGTVRLRPQGSAGGHHGLQSCLDVLGTEHVARLRIGVGTAELPRDLEEFVLSPFRQEERPIIRRALDRAVEACEAWVTEGMDAAMNRYNVPQDAGS